MAVPSRNRRRFVRTRNVLGDLFAIFPPLPGMPRPPMVEQQRRVLVNVDRTRRQARENVKQQRAAAERIRAKWASSRGRSR